MSISRQLARFAIASFVFCGIFFPSSESSAQNLNVSGASNCTVADFDTELRFVNGPENYYSVVVDKRNISSHPCVFDGPVYGPSFVPDRVPGHEPYGLCYYCEERLPNGQVPIAPPVTVHPGQVARQTFRWRTTSSGEAAPCVEPKWMAGPVLVVAQSLLKKICSDVEVSRFRVAPEGDEGEAGEGGRELAFQLTANKGLYYQGESFSLSLSRRLSRAHAGTETPVGEGGCPTLYLRQRSPDGETRIDEVRPRAFKGCGSAEPGHEPGDWQSGFDLDAGANSRWSGVGEHTMQVFQLASSTDDPELHFAASNVVRIQIADSSAIARKWGPRVKGIAADITLDKEMFRIGEDVPLHLAVEDFDAAVPVYSWDPVWDPCMVVGIEVWDAGGHPLSESKRFPNWSLCTGHGFGPKPVAKGKVIPMERTLGREGWLPNQPGTYTVVITWEPCFESSDHGESAGQAADLKPYAVVHAEATIRVVAQEGPHRN